jgi:Flp pilus assembly protein TadG
MTRISQLRANRQKGSATVEYGLVLGIFIMVIWGIIQFSLILFGYNNATYASRVAVRYAVVHGSTSTTPCSATDIQNMITPLLWGAPSGGYTVTPTWTPNNSPGSTISIKVSISYTPKLPFYPSRAFTVGTTAYGTILQ